MRTDTVLSMKRRMAMAEIQRRGLNVIQQGEAWRIYGPGVDLLICDLSVLDPASLTPVRWAHGGRAVVYG